MCPDVSSRCSFLYLSLFLSCFPTQVASLNGDSQAYLVQGVRVLLVKNNVETGKVV